MRKLITFLLCIFSFLQIYSQAYDSILAKKWGADEYGMKKYVIAFLKTGLAQIIDKDERSKLFQGHFQNMNRLAQEGKLAIAGPFETNDFYRGIFILNTPSIDTAKAWTNMDPTIQAGVFEVLLLPWYGSAALMSVNETHTIIQRKKIVE
ncbi:MAG: YciI family protein [Bacteroidota bacterium]|nr:YciI family protein [Bacteroidota bacterium]